MTEQSERDYTFDEKPHIMIIRSLVCGEVGDSLVKGAIRLLDQVGVSHAVHIVPGLIDIPAAILYAVKSLNFDATRRRYDGYVVLGGVAGKGREENFLAEQTVIGVQRLVLNHTLAVGNGIMFCDSPEQALALADPNRGNQGGLAAESCLRLIEMKHHFRLSPKRRWVGK